MKIFQRCFLLLILVSVSMNASGQSVDDFTAHFFDQENIADYIEKIDSLISQSEANILSSLDDVREKMPRARTGNGINMAYTIFENTEGVNHHFSVSRPPYLATVFGVDIVTLFGDRAGLPFPPDIKISKNQVFHAAWSFSKENAEQKKKEIAELRAENRREKDYKKILIRVMEKVFKLKPHQMINKRVSEISNPEPKPAIYLKPELSNIQAAGWLAYAASLGQWDDLNNNKNGTNLYEREVYAREKAATAWSELKEKNSDAVEYDLDIMLRVKDAGFIREFVWHFFKKPDWTIPADLKLENFKEWKEKNIPDYTPATKGSLTYN